MISVLKTLDEALTEALASLPPGTRGRDVSGGSMDSFDGPRFDFVTEYDPALAFGHPPILRSAGSFSWTGTFDEKTAESLRRSVQRLAERHREEWAFIHGPEVAEAAKKWAAERA